MKKGLFQKQAIGLPMIRDLDLIKALPTNGIYTLVVFVSKEIFLTVGKLSQQRFPKGYYTGSALGKGASSLRRRISRHLQKKETELLAHRLPSGQ